MTEIGTELVPLPDGQLVPLNDPAACAVALDDLRNLEARIREAKMVLIDALETYVGEAGRGKTIHVGDVTFVLKNDKEILWDAQKLERDLREAGMGEERIREIVVEEVSYKVAAAEARKAASVNPAYAHAVAEARSEIPKRPSITVKR